MGDFTPGPWRVDPNYSSDIQTRYGKLEIASTAEETLHGGVKPCRAEQRANARLIAAAPDLLEAAELVDDDCMETPDGMYVIGREAMRKIEAAIAKATGKDA